MQLEFHQLDRRWEHLRVRQPHRQGRLIASLAESGQQTPIVVVAAADHSGRYVVIDGYKRIAALQQLGRDTVEATAWAMSEAEALLLDRSLRFSPHESALEQGWLLSEMEQCFGYGLDELARRFDRSVSWVSRRLALVELLPEAIQQQVREGSLGAGLAMKYLVPVARVSVEDCQRMAAAFVQHRCDTRQAGQLYAAWREGSRVVRERILAEPELFLKTRRQPDSSAIWRWRLPSCIAPAGSLPKPCRRWTAGNRNKRRAKSKTRAANSTGWRRESERNRERNMLSQAQRTAILELSAKGVTRREIARVLQLSRLTVRKVLRSNSTHVPEIQRAEKAEPYREQIIELLISCKGNLVRVHEELTASGAALSYPALTAFC